MTTRRSAQRLRRFSWISPKLEVRESPIRGRGVFARAEIRREEIICVASGMVISEAEYLRRKGRRLRFTEQYATQIAEGFFLIAGEREADLEADDFFNHSCAPNCGWRGQVLMAAMRRIRRGEELTYDYAMTDSDPELRMECHCEAPDCRGTVTGEDWKLPALQRKYRGFFCWYLQERIEKRRRGAWRQPAP